MHQGAKHLYPLRIALGERRQPIMLARAQPDPLQQPVRGSECIAAAHTLEPAMKGDSVTRPLMREKPALLRQKANSIAGAATGWRAEQ